MINADNRLATSQIVIEGLHTAQALVRFEPHWPGSRRIAVRLHPNYRAYGRSEY